MKRFAGIEGLRAVLAWWVVFSHAFGWSGLRNVEHLTAIKLAANGRIPVYVFVIISGFVITHLVTQKREPYGLYITRRFLRLWPMMALVISIGIILHIFDMDLRLVPEGTAFAHALLELSLLHGLPPANWIEGVTNAFSGPGWSVSLEWQFYLIAPFLIRAFTSRHWSRWIVLAALVALLLAAGVRNNSLTVFGRHFAYSTPGFLPFMIEYFLVGMGSYWLLQQPVKIPTMAAALALGVVGYSLGVGRGYGLALALWFAFFASLTAENSPIQSILKSRPLQFLGTLSYSSYLLHLPVMIFVNRLLARHVTEPETWTRCWLLFFACAAVTIPLSWLTHRFVEMPAVRFGKRLSPDFLNWNLAGKTALAANRNLSDQR